MGGALGAEIDIMGFVLARRFGRLAYARILGVALAAAQSACWSVRSGRADLRSVGSYDIMLLSYPVLPIAAVEELSAHEEIRDALVRYTRGVDREDMTLVRSVFQNDAHFQFPESLHQGSLDSFMNFATHEFQRFLLIRNAITNVQIDFDGPDVAYVETYFDADHQGIETHH